MDVEVKRTDCGRRGVTRMLQGTSRSMDKAVGQLAVVGMDMTGEVKTRWHIASFDRTEGDGTTSTHFPRSSLWHTWNVSKCKQ